MIKCLDIISDACYKIGNIFGDAGSSRILNVIDSIEENNSKKPPKITVYYEPELKQYRIEF